MSKRGVNSSEIHEALRAFRAARAEESAACKDYLAQVAITTGVADGPRARLEGAALVEGQLEANWSTTRREVDGAFLRLQALRLAWAEERLLTMVPNATHDDEQRLDLGALAQAAARGLPTVPPALRLQWLAQFESAAGKGCDAFRHALREELGEELPRLIQGALDAHRSDAARWVFPAARCGVRNPGGAATCERAASHHSSTHCGWAGGDDGVWETWDQGEEPKIADAVSFAEGLVAPDDATVARVLRALEHLAGRQEDQGLRSTAAEALRELRSLVAPSDRDQLERLAGELGDGRRDARELWRALTLAFAAKARAYGAELRRTL